MSEKKSKVVVVPCFDYDEERIYTAMKLGIDALGGIGTFVKPSEKILVKPNFLSAKKPEDAVTTHPAVLRAMFKILKEAGCGDVSYGDSPGTSSCKAVAKELGIDLGETYGAKLCDMSTEVKFEFPEGQIATEFYYTKEIAEADAIINICKMKTHCLERITGAVKNVYGFICGMRKAAGHAKFPNATIFARMLTDIHKSRPIRLHIMDGILAMEGNGPANGTPIAMNVLLFSVDPVALDSVFCHLVHLNPEAVPTNSQGQVLGIGYYEPEYIDVILAEMEEGSNAGALTPITMDELVARFGNPAFDVDRAGSRKSLLSRWSDFTTRFTRRPKIDASLCVKCGVCVNHCPVPGKALDFTKGKDKPPVYDYSKCIRCYCCQEMCPKKAIRSRG